MMTAGKLAALLAELKCQVTGDLTGVEITALTADSRQVQPGTLFVAVQGVSADGHDYLDQAVAAGAAAVVVNHHRQRADLDVVQIGVPDTGMMLGRLAAAFYGNPAARMQVVGITGTNGKTTCSYLLEEMVVAAGGRPGVIGTVNFRYGDICQQASHTTPDAVRLQGLLADMVKDGVTHLIMEVSSHALKQGRVEGIGFDVALFTNLSRDHLDFHGDMEAYFASKKALFSRYLKKQGQAVIVTEGGESWGARLVRELAAAGVSRVITCGPGQQITSRDEHIDLTGITMTVELAGREMTMQSPLVGAFNTRNILGVLGVGQALGLAPDAMRQALGHCHGAPGRMESVVLPGGDHPRVIVDYAHTPDALENVLATIRPLTEGRLLVVFGCGGERDRGKRPMMGGIAIHYADLAIATSDNPRNEDPQRILKDIEAGMQEHGGKRVEVDRVTGQGREYLVIESRRAAIAGAIQLAGRNDVVLISGKGHEDYQLTRSGRVHFDDRQEAKEELEKVWGKAVGAA